MYISVQIGDIRKTTRLITMILVKGGN